MAALFEYDGLRAKDGGAVFVFDQLAGADQPGGA